MTKVIIQIPCYNEEECLPHVLAGLPRALPGVDEVEWLVVDDGSRDRTVALAREHGVHHVVVLPGHQGLARAFVAGLEAAVRAGADIIVNTDADNQYASSDIPRLIAPILAGEASIVIGARAIDRLEEFSATKRCLQRLGTLVTRLVSGTDVQDAVSGFRAMSRDAAMRLHVFNRYTYTVETIIQAGQKGIPIKSVPINTNRALRPSRLIRGLPTYLSRQILTMIRVFVTYRAFRFFTVPATVMFLIGFVIGVRFLWHYLHGQGTGHVQSLILAALLMTLGFFLGVMGLVGDLIAVNRSLLEDVDWRLRQVESGMRRDNA